MLFLYLGNESNFYGIETVQVYSVYSPLYFLYILYLTQLKFEIEISGRVYVLNLGRHRVHMRCQISKFKVELLNMSGIEIFGSLQCSLYLILSKWN